MFLHVYSNFHFHDFLRPTCKTKFHDFPGMAKEFQYFQSYFHASQVQINISP